MEKSINTLSIKFFKRLSLVILVCITLSCENKVEPMPENCDDQAFGRITISNNSEETDFKIYIDDEYQFTISAGHSEDYVHVPEGYHKFLAKESGFLILFPEKNNTTIGIQRCKDHFWDFD